MKKRKLIAHHEAGHAVVGWYLNLVPKVIVLNDRETALKEGALGYVRQKYKLSRSNMVKLEHGYPDARTWDIGRRLIISLIAGTAVERHLAGRGRLWRAGSHSDFSTAYDLAERLHVGDQDQAKAFLRYCQSVSLGMVAWKWKYIEAVAAALHERKRLSLEDFREVLHAESDRQMDERDPQRRARVAHALAAAEKRALNPTPLRD